MPAIEVTCPVCAAEAGTPCRCATGFVHAARREAAEDAYWAAEAEYDAGACTICDGLHGGICPLEDSGRYDDEPEWAR